jgi:hypothetical protein
MKLVWIFVQKGDAGNVTEEFHCPWCNSTGVTESYVKERLQRGRIVVVSGPFKKLFQRPSERFITSSPAIKIQGRPSALKHRDRHWTGSHSASRRKRAVVKMG